MTRFRRIGDLEVDDYGTRLTVITDDGLIHLTSPHGYGWRDRGDWVPIVRSLTLNTPECFAPWPDVRHWLQCTDDARIRMWQRISELDPQAVFEDLTCGERRRFARFLDPDEVGKVRVPSHPRSKEHGRAGASTHARGVEEPV